MRIHRHPCDENGQRSGHKIEILPRTDPDEIVAREGEVMITTRHGGVIRTVVYLTDEEVQQAYESMLERRKITRPVGSPR